MPTPDWDAEEYHQRSALQAWLAELHLARVELEGDERALDVGCGDGKITASIAARAGGEQGSRGAPGGSGPPRGPRVKVRQTQTHDPPKRAPAPPGLCPPPRQKSYHSQWDSRPIWARKAEILAFGGT